MNNSRWMPFFVSLVVIATLLIESTSAQDLGLTTTYSFNKTVSFRVFPIATAKSPESDQYFGVSFVSLVEENDDQNTNTIPSLLNLPKAWTVQGPTAFDYPTENGTEVGPLQQALILLNELPGSKDGILNVTSYYFPRRVPIFAGNQTLYLAEDSLFVGFVLKNWPFRSRSRLFLTMSVTSYLQQNATVRETFFGQYPGVEVLVPVPRGGVGRIFFPLSCTLKDSQRPGRSQETVISVQQQPGKTLLTIAFPTFTEAVSYSTLYSLELSSASAVFPLFSLIFLSLLLVFLSS
eukprot:TRINITY_DN224_c0_g1_i2.p1 TRINITY_DN224_c0_g1~~TRINITY_DN224_c0_g1_i2.p1  ORF type:complete len:292 (-),score=49.54 TRINITY_DN224_c0_g1_i2:1295-2170(-)